MTDTPKPAGEPTASTRAPIARRFCMNCAHYHPKGGREQYGDKLHFGICSARAIVLPGGAVRGERLVRWKAVCRLWTTRFAEHGEGPAGGEPQVAQ